MLARGWSPQPGYTSVGAMPEMDENEFLYNCGRCIASGARSICALCDCRTVADRYRRPAWLVLGQESVFSLGASSGHRCRSLTILVWADLPADHMGNAIARTGRPGNLSDQFQQLLVGSPAVLQFPTLGFYPELQLFWCAGTGLLVVGAPGGQQKPAACCLKTREGVTTMREGIKTQTGAVGPPSEADSGCERR